MDHGSVKPGLVLHGTYRLIRRLAAGGMGVVYEAEHLRLSQKRFAIKVLSPTVLADSDAYLRFRREAEIVGGLGHPNIISVVDFNELPTGQPYIVMELLEGEDLRRCLKRVGRLPPRLLMQVVEEASEGLQAAHDQGVVHRDLKPANIYLMRRSPGRIQVKLLDFGISKIGQTKSAMTQSRMILGTPEFMAPEQARGQVALVDHRSDQFALGCITYFALCGKLPFEAEDTMGVLWKVCFEQPPSIATLLPGLPDGVQHVLGRAMAKAKSARFEKVEDLAKALKAALHPCLVEEAKSAVPMVEPADTGPGELALSALEEDPLLGAEAHGVEDMAFLRTPPAPIAGPQVPAVPPPLPPEALTGPRTPGRPPRLREASNPRLEAAPSTDGPDLSQPLGLPAPPSVPDEKGSTEKTEDPTGPQPLTRSVFAPRVEAEPPGSEDLPTTEPEGHTGPATLNASAGEVSRQVRLPSRPRRSRGPWAVGGLAALLVIGLAFYLYTRQKNQNQENNFRPAIAVDRERSGRTLDSGLPGLSDGGRPIRDLRAAASDTARSTLASPRSVEASVPDRAFGAVRVTLHLDPPEARVFVDGVTRVDRPLRFDPGQGPVRLRVEAPGYEPHEQVLSADHDQALSVTLTPVRRTPSPVSSTHESSQAGDEPVPPPKKTVKPRQKIKKQQKEPIFQDL